METLYKVVRAAMFILLTMVSSYFAYKAIQKYRENIISTAVKKVYHESQIFPDITICSRRSKNGNTLQQEVKSRLNFTNLESLFHTTEEIITVTQSFGTGKDIQLKGQARLHWNGGLCHTFKTTQNTSGDIADGLRVDIKLPEESKCVNKEEKSGN